MSLNKRWQKGDSLHYITDLAFGAVVNSFYTPKQIPRILLDSCPTRGMLEANYGGQMVLSEGTQLVSRSSEGILRFTDRRTIRRLCLDRRLSFQRFPKVVGM